MAIKISYSDTISESSIIYLSGAISGLPYAEYMKNFQIVEDELKRQGFKYIINPAKISALLPSCLQYGDYMQFDLQLLSKCTEMITIIDVMNWNYENSKGCALEFAFANTHNIPISKCYIGL